MDKRTEKAVRIEQARKTVRSLNRQTDELASKLFPGEQEAIDIVQQLGAKYGYGNLIDRLKDAWSESLQKTSGVSKETADMGAEHICAWCRVDHRTGEKVPPTSKQQRADIALDAARVLIGMFHEAVESLPEQKAEMFTLHQKTIGVATSDLVNWIMTQE